jgi:hypothetical protein
VYLGLAVARCTISICDYSLNQKATKEVDLPWLTLFVPGPRRRAGSGFALESDGQVKLSDDLSEAADAVIRMEGPNEAYSAASGAAPVKG